MRNLGLLLAASIGWFFFYWRAKSADQDAITADKGLTAERLTRAIDQLASGKPSIRLGGIRSLEQIALSHKEERTKIIQILVARITEISPRRNFLKVSRERHKHLDIEMAVKTLANITKNLVDERNSFCILANIDLRSLHFEQIDLSNFSLINTDLTASNFKEVDFTGTKLSESVIDGVTFENCETLTQKQVMSANWSKGGKPRVSPQGWQLLKENSGKDRAPQDLMKLPKARTSP